MKEPIWAIPGFAVVDLLARGEITPFEVLTSIEGRVAEINPQVNALPTLCFARAREAAHGLESKPLQVRGRLAGLPIPIKDSYEVKGVRTTWGSLAYADHIAQRSDYLVQAIEEHGGIVFAKSNTPEFEAGANTFNEVFGRTLNPWNTALSAGGSSGGAAVAVATGMAFIAQGSDFACSLRYPAAFCGIVGLRPSPGIVPQGPSRVPHQVLSVIGPLGRSVEDTALGLDGMAAFDARDPLTRPLNAGSYRQSARQPRRPEKIAFSMDLGFVRVSREIDRSVRDALQRLASAGLGIEQPTLDLSRSDNCFRTLRAFQFAALRRQALIDHRDKLKPEVVWNIEEGLKLNALQIADAELELALLRQSLLALLDEHDFLITPTAPVEPFPVEQRFVNRIDGVELHTYLDWLALGFAITVCGCPTISIPCGLTKNRLPAAIQIIGKPYGEHDLLSFAVWCESILKSRLDKPIDPRVSA